MSIASDFSIDVDNRIIRHETGTDIYLVNDLYSYIHDYFDEIISMTVDVPMSAQTPTEYSLINGWFIPEKTLRYLRTGAIKTVGWDTALYSNGIFIVTLQSGGYVSCITSDIGQVVTDGSETGVLLDYDNTLRKWWVRKTSAGSLSGPVTISGTGSGTISTVVSGESLFSNVYTLGALNPLRTNTLYVEQVNPELIDNQVEQYWLTGHIDIIIKVKEANTLINSGAIRIYCREYMDLYSHFAIDLSSGGRNPVPLSTATDGNNQTSGATVAAWTDVTITFGAITRDIQNGAGYRPYDVEIDCGSRTTISEVYERLKLVTSRDSGIIINGTPGQFYRAASGAYGENTTAPFGSYAGGIFFGERGVFLKNVPGADANNYKLIDSTNTEQLPPYLAGGALIFNSVLAADGADAIYRLFYKQINPAGTSLLFGTIDAVLVKKGDAVTNISGTLAGNLTSIPFTFDFYGNTQAVWAPSITYNPGDFFRQGVNWYKVITGYLSGLTFGATDLLNVVSVLGPDVVLTSAGLSSAQYVQSPGTIIRSTSNNISAVGSVENNYTNV